MRTNQWMVIITILAGMTSCSTSNRVISQINRDGSMHREVYAYGDSAFLAGDKAHHPFFFQLNSRWKLQKLDSTLTFNYWGNEEKFNLKVSQLFSTVNGECFSTLDGKEYMRPLVIPNEELQKSFRWFYTYYKYKATYHELPDKGPIPLDQYMNKQEQRIWFQGDAEALKGLNGIEQNEKLDDMEAKFWKWFNRTQYELCYETIFHFASLKNNTDFTQQLTKLKEPIYKKYLQEKQTQVSDDSSIENVCSYLDELSQTKHFSALYKANAKMMNELLEQKGQATQLFNYTTLFELSLPGKVVFTNATIQKDGSLIWKVDAFRLLSSNYTLLAESRTINYWAFGVTLLCIASICAYCRILYKKKRQ